jgi:ADP-ribose pyrophosphatase
MLEKTLSSRTLYTGRVLTLEILDVELEDGRPAVREIIRHARAVAVLPRLPDGRFLWVRQYRKAMEEDVVEVCAGLVEPGEAPEAAARRELAEETGWAAGRLVPLGEVYSSPGYSDEKVDLYFAECTGPAAAAAQDEDERVETVALSPEEIGEWIRTGAIRDAKSIAAWLLYRSGRAGA